jgi:hypothetical protein
MPFGIRARATRAHTIIDLPLCQLSLLRITPPRGRLSPSSSTNRAHSGWPAAATFLAIADTASDKYRSEFQEKGDGKRRIGGARKEKARRERENK